MKKPKIKILVVGHKESPVLNNEIYIPIQAGKKISNKKLSKPWIGDDTGDNISEKNKEYCELTALYWAWKNLKDVDYIGLCHYRRYFSLEALQKNRRGILFYFKKISDKVGIYFLARKIYRTFYKKIPKEEGELQTKYFSFFEKHLNEIPSIKKEIVSHDIILPIKSEVPNPPIRNSYFKYGPIHKQDYKEMEKIIKSLKKDYVDAFEQVSNGKYIYLCNMFIAKKDIFYEYCKWLFPLLLKLEKKIKPNLREGYDRRAIGLLSEILLNVWIEKNKGLNIKELPVEFIG